ncbi:MAG: ATP-binding protein [Acidimicrobiales bacterium]
MRTGRCRLTLGRPAWDHGTIENRALDDRPPPAPPAPPARLEGGTAHPYAAGWGPPANGRPGPAPRSWRALASTGGWHQLRRPAQGRAIGGVAWALAGKLGISPLGARAAFVALSFVGGLGIVLYMAGWLCLAPEGDDAPVLRAALGDRRTVALVAAAASVLAALMAAVSALGHLALLGSVSPGFVSLAGLVAVWRHAGPEDRVALGRLTALLSGAEQPSAPTRRRVLVACARFVAGAFLIALGTSTLMAPKDLNGADLIAALAAVGVVAGFSLILAPWWLRLGRELAAERRQRARAEERAEMASHLHDSVLQTLALIQRSAGDPQQVQRLARSQERQLRSWLFNQEPAASPGGAQAAQLSAALGAIQQDVEADHGVRVEVVVVGDTTLEEQLGALVAATREAVVNAAKWSGAEVVSIYAEVEPQAVSVFVRDRGQGFDPATVAPDRKGLSESVHARTRRNGGTSAVRTAPGEGTEVALSMPRKAGP